MDHRALGRRRHHLPSEPTDDVMLDPETTLATPYLERLVVGRDVLQLSALGIPGRSPDPVFPWLKNAIDAQTMGITPTGGCLLCRSSAAANRTDRACLLSGQWGLTIAAQW